MKKTPTPEATPTTALELVHYDRPLLTADDLYWFNEGTHYRLYNKMGAHPLTLGGVGA
jgi:1,4-alpha-glucan branching enzyme